MPLSLSEASVPVFTRAFANLSAILQKAAAHAAAQKLDPATLIEARLFPDMHALPAQIQRASDTAKGCAARLAGIEAPKFPDEEKTFADLQARIEKTVAFLRTVDAAKIDAGETRDISFHAGKTTLHFKGKDYLLNFALPNFFFHVTTAYDILRHKGVVIGKMDFLGNH